MLRNNSIKINQYFKELETKAVRVYPDNDDFIKILRDYISLPKFLKEQKRFETRSLTEIHYNWDLIAKRWEEYFDKVELTGLQGQWDENLAPLEMIKEAPQSVSNYDALIQLISRHLPNHQVTSSMILLNMLRDLDYGFILNGLHTEGYDMSKAINILNNLIQNNNLAYNAKNNMNNLTQEDFVQYAHMKEQLK